MATRAILLVAFTVFLFPAVVCADDAPKLPSRRATVVLPLLEQMTLKDMSYFSPNGPSVQIDKILGEPDFGTANGGHAIFYRLDDKTEIWVQFLSANRDFRIMNLNSITVKTREARVIKTIYPKPD